MGKIIHEGENAFRIKAKVDPRLEGARIFVMKEICENDVKVGDYVRFSDLDFVESMGILRVKKCIRIHGTNSEFTNL